MKALFVISLCFPVLSLTVFEQQSNTVNKSIKNIQDNLDMNLLKMTISIQDPCLSFTQDKTELPNIANLVQKSPALFAECLGGRLQKMRTETNTTEKEWKQMQTDLSILNLTLLKHANQNEVSALVNGLKPMIKEVDDKVGNNWLVPFFLVLFGIVFVALVVVTAFIIKSKFSPRSEGI